MWSNFYSTTAGSFIEINLSTQSRSSNVFIINETGFQYTTAGSLIQSRLLAQSKSRNWFLINESSLDQRPPVRLIKPNPKPWPDAGGPVSLTRLFTALRKSFVKSV
jgi:hypothetical protein